MIKYLISLMLVIMLIGSVWLVGSFILGEWWYWSIIVRRSVGVGGLVLAVIMSVWAEEV